MMDALRDLLGPSPLEWIPTVTLLFLLTWQSWNLYAPSGYLADLLGKCATGLTVFGLLAPPLAASPVFWLALSVVQLAWIATAYYLADNHFYLVGYWCLTVCVALAAGGSAGELILARNARLLIGLCFACAVVAKLMSRRYRDNSFFTYLLVMDFRFLALATYLGGLTPHGRRQHLAAAARVRDGRATQQSGPVGARLRRTAWVLTWWTVGIEAIVAVVFLLPWPGLEWPRLAILGVFALSTFSLVSVPSFGQILMLMLVAATEDVGMRSYVLILAVGMTLLSFIPQILRRLALEVHAPSRRPSLGALLPHAQARDVSTGSTS